MTRWAVFSEEVGDRMTDATNQVAISPDPWNILGFFQRWHGTSDCEILLYAGPQSLEKAVEDARRENRNYRDCLLGIRARHPLLEEHKVVAASVKVHSHCAKAHSVPHCLRLLARPRQSLTAKWHQAQRLVLAHLQPPVAVAHVVIVAHLRKIRFGAENSDVVNAVDNHVQRRGFRNLKNRQRESCLARCLE
jgi:hypothetical protein